MRLHRHTANGVPLTLVFGTGVPLRTQLVDAGLAPTSNEEEYFQRWEERSAEIDALMGKSRAADYRALMIEICDTVEKRFAPRVKQYG